MKVLFDDLRDIPADIICRTPEGMDNFLLHVPTKAIDVLYLDHDLGIHDGVDISVLDVLQHAVRDWGLPIEAKKIHIVSSNPCGIQNIKAFLVNECGYRARNNCILFKD